MVQTVPPELDRLDKAIRRLLRENRHIFEYLVSAWNTRDDLLDRLRDVRRPGGYFAAKELLTQCLAHIDVYEHDLTVNIEHLRDLETREARIKARP